MPGLIDAHWHAMLIRPNPVEAIAGDVGSNNIAAGVEAGDTLMRGFTTVRDVGGPVFGLKSAIDSGLIARPRIYPSGAVITVTSGHGDFRQHSDLPRTIGGMLSRMEQIGGSMVADSGAATGRAYRSAAGRRESEFCSAADLHISTDAKSGGCASA